MSALLCKWFGWWCIVNPVVNPPEVPVNHQEDVKKAVEALSVEAIVNANGCKNISWANRGKAPIGFYLGMAKTYVQTKCDKGLSARLTKAPHSKEDAYSRYGLKPTLPNVYALLTGLAIRESTGDFCEGRDMSAGWTQSDTAESGLHQTSYNSNAFSPYLKVFFKNWNKNGFREDFAKGVTCTANMWKYWGTGADGLRFQKMSKEQPAFHVEYTALLLKETYKHHGPLVRKEVQLQKPCLELFETLDKLVSCP
jgi:hypothetical protein